MKFPLEKYVDFSILGKLYYIPFFPLCQLILFCDENKTFHLWKNALFRSSREPPTIRAFFKFSSCANEKSAHKRGIRAFSGAPRSAIINGVLCRQAFLLSSTVRQSVLLPQNGFSRPKLFFSLGHANAYLSAFALLAPKKRYQRFSWRAARPSNPSSNS